MEPVKTNVGKAYVSPMSGGEIELAVVVQYGKFPEMMVVPADALEDLWKAIGASLGKNVEG